MLPSRRLFQPLSWLFSTGCALLCAALLALLPVLLLLPSDSLAAEATVADGAGAITAPASSAINTTIRTEIGASINRANADATGPAATPAVSSTSPTTAPPKLDSGDTAWMLTSTLLVVLMIVPGLALFYGGLGRSKNMLSVLLQVFMIFSVVTLLWVAYGYSLTFSGEGHFWGDGGKLFLSGIAPGTLSHLLPTVPEYVFVAFQATFAAITVALIVGAFAERMRFAAVMIFTLIWFTGSYIPVAHMVWGGGLLAKDGALDFAGGTVVHINAAMAALVGAYKVGKRIGYGREALTPHSLTLTMVGASLLWVGWFGFNAGSAGAANGTAGLAFVNTIVAASAAAIAWVGGEALHTGKASMLGAASGAVGGLVVITPAAGFVGPLGAIAMGLAAGVACLWGVNGLKRWLKVDDAFDVFGVHGVGGILGALLTGVFAAPSLGGTGGLTPDAFHMGHQLWVQLVSVLLTLVWSGVVALIAYQVADVAVGLRVSEEAEREGLDISSHGEAAYAR
jgi:Amt family ammonium transporter